SYNALGQLTLVQTEQPGGTTYSPYETRSYDNDGRLATDVFYNLPGHQGAGTYNGSVVTFSDAGWVQSDTFYTYNADGELVDQSQYAEESAQNLITQYGTGVASSAYATQDTAVPSAPSGVTAGALYLTTETNYAAAGPGYGYDADGNVLGYRVTTGTTTLVNGQPSTSTSTSGYLNSYIKQNSLLLTNTELTPITGSGSPSPSTTNTYNDLGELASSTGIVNGVTQSQVMAYTSGGQLLQKSTTSNGSTTTTSYESVNENELGSVDTTGAIDVLSTTGGYSNSSTGTQNYTVRAGDTLQGLAQAIYGDSNYYYILAQANGLAPTATLTAGMMLTIPQVTTDTNAANTYQPYSQGALLSGSTNALYTTAQILAMSIDAVLNQQSAIAQSVAQVEEQEREVAAAQAQAAQAAQLANQQKAQLTQDEQVTATAQQQAAKAQGAAIAAQAAEQQAQAATPAQQAQAMELAKQAAYKVEADAIRKQLGSGVSEWTAVYGTDEALVRAYQTQRAWIINKPMRDEIWSSIEDSDSQGLNFSVPDGAPGAAYLQTQTEIDTYNQKMATRMVDAIYQASTSAFFKNFTDKMIENLVNNAATDASGGDTTGGDGTDNSDGGGNGGGTGWSNFSLATAGTGVGGDTGGSVGDPSAYTQLSATATQDTSLYNQDNALVQQDRNNYQAASEQAQQDNTQVQQASTQAAQLDAQLAQETSSGGGLATIDSNGNGGNRDLYIGDGAAEQLIASEVGVGNATASTDSNSNNLASFLGGAQMLSDSSSLANLTNDTGGASSVLLGGTGGSGSLSSLTCSAPGLDGNAQGDQGQSNDPLLQSAEEYAKQGPSLYEILNGIGATPISFALGAYQGVQDGEQILKNQFSALPGEILNGIKSIPGKLAEADSGLLNFVFNTSQQQQGQIVGSILQAVSSNNIADSISSHLDAFNKSVIREFQTATPEQMGYDTGYNVTVNSPMIAANIALDGEAEALTCVADDGKGIFSASSLVPNYVATGNAQPLTYDISAWKSYGLPSDGYFARTLNEQDAFSLMQGDQVNFGGKPVDGYPNGMGFLGSAEEVSSINTGADYAKSLDLTYQPKYLLEFQLNDPAGLQNVLEAPYKEFVPGGRTASGYLEWNYPGINSNNIVNWRLRVLQ
ncbi:LysM peptidoglycan-binding domain-containing protein, partial [Dyella flagellata]|uniref:LysM peptidoglycan-binding domain-containing protein n=2 Tax=Dyella flagellata TaxID=1867833 RepID=UPI0024E0A268